MLSSAILPLKLRIVWSDPFSNVYCSCVVYVYNDCHLMSRSHQNHHSRTGLTSHLSMFTTLFLIFTFFPLLFLIWWRRIWRIRWRRIRVWSHVWLVNSLYSSRNIENRFWSSRFYSSRNIRNSFALFQILSVYSCLPESSHNIFHVFPRSVISL